MTAGAKRLWLALGFLAWCGVIARMTLDPVLGDEGAFDVVEQVIAWLNARGIPVTYLFVEAVANIFMFLPFGALLVLLFPRLRWWGVALISCATSVGIELSQLLWLPERFATVQDVVMNTLGGALGDLAVLGALKWRVARSERVGPTTTVTDGRDG